MGQTITASRLRELVELEGTDLVWRRIERNRHAGPIGGINSHGYRQVRVDYRLHYVHRLVWLYHYGENPSGPIDHIDGNKLNNAIANLRIVSIIENAQNTVGRGTSHRPGYLNPAYQSRITVNGKAMHLGVFRCEEEAHQAYLEAKRKLHPSYASGIGLNV
jgi:hypothetical protein